MIGWWAEASMIQALKDKYLARALESKPEASKGDATDTSKPEDSDAKGAETLGDEDEGGEEEIPADDPDLDADVQDVD